MTHKASLAAIVAFAASAAGAGEFHETRGFALKGYDPVAYFTERKAVRGDERLRSEHKGSIFLFSTAANRDTFAANAARYAPQYGGYCAYGVANGYKADIDPHAFSVVGDKLYVNYNLKIREDWLKDPPGHIRRADERWPQVRLTEKVHR